MDTWFKLFIMLTCVNLVLFFGLNMTSNVYNGGSLGVDGDIFDFITDRQPPSNFEGGGAPILNEDITTIDKATGSYVGSTDAISFLDIPAILWAFFITLFNILTLPIALMFYNGLPTMVGWLIGVPLSIAYAGSLMAFVRGVSS